MASNASAAQPAETGKTLQLPVNPQPAAEPKITAGPVTVPADPKSQLPTIPDPLAGASAPATTPTVAQASPEIVPPPVKPEDPTKKHLERLMETFPKAGASKAGPAAPSDVLAGAPVKKEPAETPLPVDKASTAKPIPTDHSPWTLNWEIAGGQTKLTARLNQRLEFHIVCDRLKMETPDGAVVALGKVSITGPGVKGKCNKLAIGLAGDSLVLEDKVELQVQQGSPTDLLSSVAELKGELIALRLQQPTGSIAPLGLPGAASPAAAPATAPTGSPAVSPARPPDPSPFPIPRPFPLEKKGI
jgi:hypothetical protein